MIDLHSHILPAIDDGSRSLEMSLEMARIAVADGIGEMACTPHIYPGLYMNDSAGIAAARDALQAELDERGIALKLTTGADVHLVPGILDGLRAGGIPTLNGTRYVLLEPSHHVAPPNFTQSVFQLVSCGYVPVITHPERLTWIEDSYEVIAQLTTQGAWLQVTAGALTGQFGPRPKYWAERLLGEGLVHVLATDAHASTRRVPVLSEGRAAAEKIVGAQEAALLVEGRPRALMSNTLPSRVAPLPEPKRPRWHGWRELFRRRR
ncbi:tyrosine-protein phosphatase [Caenimonas aquaedulcis]|uniref:protein-tyrosine-phosphatase n=1 Tax=Caenimonas aquaedulcis TaxID=2793270 RepID=A0A931H5J4_9BURK|nr:CpsB/CapC family capsule biosynthesis tyrosine phosphatase [Caenimonas aquaedulcis]MBG9389046.1 capsular biosynthesis protein [Caenimonas aquaedulcis]